MEDLELDIPDVDLKELLPIARNLLAVNHEDFWVFHTCKSGEEYGINAWDSSVYGTADQGSCVTAYAVDNGGSAITSNWLPLAKEGKLREIKIGEANMFEVTYQLRGPNQYFDQKVMIVNGEDTFEEFVDRLGITKFCLSGLISLKIKEMKPISL